jgi:hypothetical protein
VGTGFRKRSCSKKKLERDDESKKSHPALVAEIGVGIAIPGTAVGISSVVSIISVEAETAQAGETAAAKTAEPAGESTAREATAREAAAEATAMESAAAEAAAVKPGATEAAPVTAAAKAAATASGGIGREEHRGDESSGERDDGFAQHDRLLANGSMGFTAATAVAR